MALSTNIKRFFRYPLMWVMLLWAVTLPGHELAVYSYLMKGSFSEAALRLLLSEYGQSSHAVKQQAVQVFLDARTAAAFTLSPQQAIRCVLNAFTSASPADNQPNYAPQFASAELLARLLPGYLQPNAP